MQTIQDKMLIYDENAEDRLSILKITALWAFSESAFGGILHALTIPFRGLFIASAAVLFISLIALFSKSSKEILKATLIVILIKAVVSPHSPLTAYIAVSLQGMLGFSIFLNKKILQIICSFVWIDGSVFFWNSENCCADNSLRQYTLGVSGYFYQASLNRSIQH